MTCFVLVHGAWHGGWCWSRLRPLLAEKGHRVLAPTLTGLADRSHLLTRDLDLETHVLDVANLIEWEDLTNIVLVGHSYGGLVTGQVADRLADRIACLIYLDAYVPQDGKALFDFLPDSGEADRTAAAVHGQGWLVPPRNAASFGVNPADAAWIDRKCTPHPLSCFATLARLSGAAERIANIGYMRATTASKVLDPFYERAEDVGWWRERLPCGHEIMIDLPRELARILLEHC